MNVLELSYLEACDYFMEPQCYGSMELPQYFDFSPLLNFAKANFGKFDFSKKNLARIGEFDGVNYTLVDNKDGKYAWRPLQLIHPLLYVALVDVITNPDNWRLICERFREFASCRRIKCVSYPIVKKVHTKTKADQIHAWWTDFEQRSLALSLRYRHMFVVDITNCYGSIYTHAIPWALHGKPDAKGDRTWRLLGNQIDSYIRAMRYGQTNGIPQGSVLMDFIAEMVLGSIDLRLSEMLDAESDDDYCILRYRDDYRVFVNDSSAGERVLRLLTLALEEYGMRFNSAKTYVSADIVGDAVKGDKLAWFEIAHNYDSLSVEKRLLLLYRHASRFPNCGSILQPLAALPEHIKATAFRDCNQIFVCAAIVAELAYRNPRGYQLCMACVAELMEKLSVGDRARLTADILEKFSRLPNTGNLQIWLQRIAHPCGISLNYTESLCRCVENAGGNVWSNEWLVEQPDLFRAFESPAIVDWNKLRMIPPTMGEDEITLFIRRYQEVYQG